MSRNPRWHPEGDVHVHAGLSADKAADLADREGLTGHDRAVVVLAALVHDFGKSTHTQHTVDEHGQTRITSHGHDRAGVAPADEFLQSIGAPTALRERILPLVREHMCAVTVHDVSKSAVRRLARRLEPATIHEWALVTAADKGGRGPGNVDPRTEKWLELYEVERASMKPNS